MTASKWNTLWAVPWGLLSWLVVEVVVFMPLYLLGTILCPFLWAPRTMRESRLNPGQPVEAFRWAWMNELWGNHEDGLLPDWWKDQGGTRFSWHLRNPICNMRFWPLVSTWPMASVRWIGTAQEILPAGRPGWFLAWQGGYVGFFWQNASWGLWLGWKLNPRDAQPGAPKDYRYAGVGTACQLLRS